MRPIGETAVVLGAGMGGLLCARALADGFERVVVVDRDDLSGGAAPRRAVPQGRHAHALLARGHACLEELLPGITGDLLARGAQPYRAMAQLRIELGGHPLARGDVGTSSIVAGRPLIEACVRGRVRALANVELRDGTDAAGLIARDGRVTGVRLLARAPGSAEEHLPASLVVAAMGRGGRLGAWLQALGHEAPEEERIDVDVAYASCRLEMAPGALGDDRLVLIGARPGLPRTLALFAQEDGRHLLTLGGYAGHHPPRERDAFLAFAGSVAPPGLAAAIRAAIPAGDIVGFRFPANVRRRYRRLPDGLLPAGDAICALNPIYGQGMTVAALQAVALRTCLRDGADGLERRHLAAAERIADAAWRLAAGADLAVPDVPGPRPIGVRVFNAYVRRILAAAERDPGLALAFLRVSGMVDPPHALLRPRVALRALGPAPRRGRRAPAEADPPAWRRADVEPG
jgi:2-polyprenyl-6-methoxyphenol hydroxylase-like FAD-dependent oxidoreductase